MRVCLVNSLPGSLTVIGNLRMDGFNKKLLLIAEFSCVRMIKQIKLPQVVSQ